MGAESVWSFVGRIRPKERCVLVGDQMSDVHVDSHVLATLRDVMEDEYALLLETFLTDSDERLRLLRETEAQADALAMRMASKAAAAIWGQYCWPVCASSWKTLPVVSSLTV